MRYAAYGSNLHPLRLRARVPSARFRHATAINGHALRFDKRGSDGSAKANVRPEPGSTAFVAVFDLDPRHRPILDAIEGPGYRAGRIVLADGHEAYTYFAIDTDEDEPPYGWYRDLVLEGARAHQFPEWYIHDMLSLPVKPDPDLRRRRKNHELLEHMRGFSGTQALAAFSGR